MIVDQSLYFISCCAQPSFTNTWEACIPKNDCRQFMHSSFFAKCFQFWCAWNKVHVRFFFCKMCIHKHSDKPVLDPNWNLQKCNLRKCIASSLTALNTFLWIWNSSEAFESNCWRKCLWDGSLVSCFCQLTPNFEFCCFHLSYCFCLLCFTAVNTKEQFQKLKGR